MVPIPDGLFTYNGTDNLVVDVSVPAGSATNAVRNLAGSRVGVSTIPLTQTPRRELWTISPTTSRCASTARE
jgi:hypothetical protein